jgi:hypothetical protein
MTQIKEKIAFKLSTPEAVEYANAHSKNGAGRYELCNDHYFHLPHFDVYEGLYGHSALTILPGYTDVTPNFLEDYYRPWKDKLASEKDELTLEDWKKASLRGLDSYRELKKRNDYLESQEYKDDIIRKHYKHLSQMNGGGD